MELISQGAPPLADVIAAGNLRASEVAGIAPQLARRALVNGFGAVMLYAVVCAWTASLLSLVVLGRGRASCAIELDTCGQAHAVNPQAWLADVLDRIGKGHPINRIEELLPWNWLNENCQ